MKTRTYVMRGQVMKIGAVASRRGVKKYASPTLASQVRLEDGIRGATVREAGLRGVSVRDCV